MDARPTPPPPSGESGLPAVRPPTPSSGPATHARDVPPPETSGTSGGAGDARASLASADAHAQGAAGLAILAAALLLWPFAGWFWIPWLAGLVVLVLVALLRLDRLLHGWSWHLGGLAVLVGLMLNTGPWDWALAASLGVLLAGLVQLPWWRLAAVGAVLCLLAGAGWGSIVIARRRKRRRRKRSGAAEREPARRVVRPDLVLPGWFSARRAAAMSWRCAASCSPNRRRHQFAPSPARRTAPVRCVRFRGPGRRSRRRTRAGRALAARTATC